MKLELAVGGDRIPWRPDSETVEKARRLVGSLGPADGVLEIILAGDDTIRGLNRRYRNKDRSTDVLSFSFLEGHEEHRKELLHDACDARAFCDEPGEGSFLVGQVFISPETMKGRQLRLDHSDEEEFLFLVVHGMLHTLGFDHEKEDDALEMEEAQEEILACDPPPMSSTREGGRRS